MRWLFKPFIRPIARRKLRELYKERDNLTVCIDRQRKAKRRVTPFYEAARLVNHQIMQWERWAE